MAVLLAPSIVDHCRTLVRFLAPSWAGGPEYPADYTHRPGDAAPRTPARELERYLAQRLGHRRQETLLCLFYGADGRFRAERMFGGTVSRTVARRAELAAGATEHGAHYVVIAHNHPGGNADPSGQDVLATRQVYRLFSALGVTLADHVIVTGGRCFSFRQAGLL